MGIDQKEVWDKIFRSNCPLMRRCVARDLHDGLWGTTGFDIFPPWKEWEEIHCKAGRKGWFSCMYFNHESYEMKIHEKENP